MKKENKKGIFVGIILVFCFLLVFVFTKNIKPEIQAGQVSENTTKEVSLQIENKRYNAKIENNETIYDLMQELQSEGKINFIEKDYSGMGKFIEAINGIKNSGEENWIYYVNGKKAEIGISNYKLHSGDVVSWKYEPQY